ncbi:hypothetical protein [Micromonospora sp. NPDC005220]|uniref:hypothetical protein n=1 Tax=Micromonospora sp. NPDC005220 TaxID=3155589 RepID=UPI0033A9E473
MSESGQQQESDRNIDNADPDVLLDIPKVSVDSIRLAVDGLDADLSLRARVANLLQVDAGVRVHLSGGELDINGVHAEAQLRVRLAQLTRILGRALDTLDNNPHIIEALVHTAIDDVNRSSQQLAAGAAEIKASSLRSDGVRDEPGRAGGPSVDRDRPGSSRPGPGRPGLDQPGSGRPGSDQPGSGRPGSDQPGSGRPSLGQPGSDRADAGRAEAGPAAGHRPEGPRHDGPRHGEEAHNQPGQSDGPARARPGTATAVCRARRKLPPRARPSSPSRRGRPCDRPDAACGRRSRAAWRSTARRVAATTDAAPPRLR